MKNTLLFLISTLSIVQYACNTGNAGSSDSNITYYEVPLVGGAAPEIGCGSRLKPLFLDTEKESQIKESWSNRQGTVIAIVWKEPIPNKTIRKNILLPIFEKHSVDAELISDKSSINKLTISFNGDGKWYRGTDVDKLSIEEAGIIAQSLTKSVNEEGLITNVEAVSIKKDIEDYFKGELTQVRSYDNLKSDETQEKWRKEGYQIYVNHIGKEKADKVIEFYAKWQEGEILEKTSGKSCCDKNETKESCYNKVSVTSAITLQSTITCPKCGYTKEETMPTDVCQFSYQCEKCNVVMNAKDGDCCVFCSYGTKPCPSIQG